jgi:hypothetical protein
MVVKDPYEPKERVLDLSANDVQNLITFCNWSLENLGLPNDEDLVVRHLKKELRRIDC